MILLQDLRFAFRILSRSPGTVAVAVLSLALGIGANTALFSLLRQAILKTLPVESPQQLVLFQWMAPNHSLVRSISGWVGRSEEGLSTSTSFPYPLFEEFHRRQEVFSSLFAFYGLRRLNVSIEGRPELQSGQLVSGDYFEGLGVRPHLGRLIAPGDDSPSAPPVVALTHSYWQSRLGGDPGVIGNGIQINGQTFQIIGVASRGFQGTLQVGEAPSLFLPMSSQSTVIQGGDRLSNRDFWWIQLMGRLRSGISPERALERMNQLMIQVGEGLWESQVREAEPGASLIPRIEFYAGSRGLREMRNRLVEPLTLAFAICGVILLVACANVANLILARSARRRAEIAVRYALGAHRGRMVRQLLTESLLVSLMGGATGLLLAYNAGPVVIALVPFTSGISFDLDLRPDGQVLGFALLISLLTGLVFGLAPALSGSRVDLIDSLRGSRTGTGGPARLRLSRSLVVLQVALSVALLVFAGLFLRTLGNLIALDPGFSTDRVLTFSIDPTLNGYRDEALSRFYERVRREIELLPEVVAVSAGTFVPLSNSGDWRSIYMAGEGEGEEAASAFIGTISPGFFETLEIPILMGRTITRADTASAPRVALVNERLARTLFPAGESPMGRFLRLERQGEEFEIVGIVPDLRQIALRREPEPSVYVPLQQRPQNRAMAFSVRTRAEPAGVAGALRKAVGSIDSNVPLFEVQTLKQQVATVTAQERQFAVLSTFFGLLGLGLACVGLYGILSHSAQRRTREIGIRLALGAVRRDIVRMIMAGLWLVLLGIGIGMGVGWAGTRFIRSMLFGLESADPWILLGAAGAMLLVAAIAAYLPARRASRTSPMEALRS